MTIKWMAGLSAARLALPLAAAVLSAPGRGACDSPNDTERLLLRYGENQAKAAGFACAPNLRAKMKEHPEWGWLPGYKWTGLQSRPYGVSGRLWELLSREIAPTASLVALHVLATQVGIQYQHLSGSSGKDMADLAWRAGRAFGDCVTAESSAECAWRLVLSNLDALQLVGGQSCGRLSGYLGQLLHWSPLLAKSVSEMLRQHLLYATGCAGIVFDTPALNERFSLTFVSSSSSADPSKPHCAHLDLDIVPGKPPITEAQGPFEEALLQLEKSARQHSLTRLRLYPAFLGDHRRNGKLVLFFRPYFADRPGPLIRFPADFGDSQDRLWWTDAVDRGILQGAYNDNQYTVVKYLNALLGYGKAVVTPLSASVLARIPLMIEQAATHPSTIDYGAPFEEQVYEAVKFASDVSADDIEVSFAEINPKQSTYHTALRLGAGGYLFIDDHESRRAELPLFTVVTRGSYNDIHVKDLENIERHLPWLPARGIGRLASSVVRGKIYETISGRLLQNRLQELEEELMEYDHLAWPAREMGRRAFTVYQAAKNTLSPEVRAAETLAQKEQSISASEKQDFDKLQEKRREQVKGEQRLEREKTEADECENAVMQKKSRLSKIKRDLLQEIKEVPAALVGEVKRLMEREEGENARHVISEEFAALTDDRTALEDGLKTVYEARRAYAEADKRWSEAAERVRGEKGKVSAREREITLLESSCDTILELTALSLLTSLEDKNLVENKTSEQLRKTIEKLDHINRQLHPYWWASTTLETAKTIAGSVGRAVLPGRDVWALLGYSQRN